MLKFVTTYQRRMDNAIPRFNKAMHRELVELWTGAAQAFVKSLVRSVHVDTGMSKASIIPLAERLRIAGVVKAAINAKRGPRLGYTDIQEVYHPKIWKSIQMGQKLGEKAYTLDFGTVGNSRLSFRFRIMIYQWAYHDERWGGTLDKAEAAFATYIAKNKERVLRKVLADLFSPVMGGAR